MQQPFNPLITRPLGLMVYWTPVRYDRLCGCQWWQGYYASTVCKTYWSMAWTGL